MHMVGHLHALAQLPEASKNQAGPVNIERLVVHGQVENFLWIFFNVP